MTLRRLLSILTMLSVHALAFVLTSCESDETTMEPPATTDIAGVPYIGAYSMNETTIAVVWSLSPDETNAEVMNPSYLIKVKGPTGDLLQSFTAVKGQKKVIVTGLTEGTVYSFVISMIIASTAVSDDSATVLWSPAKRRDTQGEPPAPIQVFETASTFNSGLDVYSASIDRPQTISMFDPFNTLIDLFVYTDTTSQDLIIRSADLSNVILLPKDTDFSSVVDSSDNLDFDRAAAPDASTYDRGFVTIPGAASGETAGRIIYGRTEENNYFRMLVVRNSGSLVFGTSPHRFLTIIISYQSMAGVPYARPVNPEHEELKRN